VSEIFLTPVRIIPTGQGHGLQPTEGYYTISVISAQLLDTAREWLYFERDVVEHVMIILQNAGAPEVNGKRTKS